MSTGLRSTITDPCFSLFNYISALVIFMESKYYHYVKTNYKQNNLRITSLLLYQKLFLVLPKSLLNFILLFAFTS